MVTIAPISYLIPVLCKSLQVSATSTRFYDFFPNIAIDIIFSLLGSSLSVLSDNKGLKGGNLKVID